MNHSSAKQDRLMARARAIIPGGVSSPVRAFGSVGGTPVFVARAEGSRIFDVDGVDYVDLVCSWGPALLGHAHPGVVGVPVIMGKGLALRFREWSPGAAMVDGPFGALVPQDGAWVVPEVLIVPLVAFDARGYRLGYGGGFYDRTLEGLRAQGLVWAVGFAFSGQEPPEVPIEVTDQRLDVLVTENGVVRF